MTAEVVPITPDTPVRQVVGEPVQDVLDIAEELVGMARDGRAHAVALVTLTGDGMIAVRWGGGPNVNRSLTAGAIARLAYQFQQGIDEQDG